MRASDTGGGQPKEGPHFPGQPLPTEKMGAAAESPEESGEAADGAGADREHPASTWSWGPGSQGLAPASFSWVLPLAIESKLELVPGSRLQHTSSYVCAHTHAHTHTCLVAHGGVPTIISHEHITSF